MSDIPDQVQLAYEAMESRRDSQDEMTWQTPALAFTAQAFLFTIALQTGASRFERLLPAALSVAISLLCVQLMRRHAYLERIDQFALEDIEERFGFVDTVGLLPHSHPHARNKPKERRLEGKKSIVWWVRGQYLFIAAAASIAAVDLFVPRWLN